MVIELSGGKALRWITLIISLSTKMSSTSSGEEDPAVSDAISPQEAEVTREEGNVHPVSLVQKIFNDPERTNLLGQAFASSNEDGVHVASKAPSSNMNSAWALKAQTASDTYAPATKKRPKEANHLADEVVIFEPGVSNHGAFQPAGYDEDDDKLCRSTL